jgi:hypothetical protein
MARSSSSVNLWLAKMTITAEYIYTEEEALRATEEVTKSMSPSLWVRLLAPLFVRNESRKRFRHNPSANKKIVWRFDEQKVEDSTDGASTVRVRKNLIEIKEVHDGFLIFPQARIAYWVPKKAFSSEADISSLRDLIRKSGVKYNG